MDHSYPYIASLTRELFLFYEMRQKEIQMIWTSQMRSQIWKKLTEVLIFWNS